MVYWYQEFRADGSYTFWEFYRKTNRGDRMVPAPDVPMLTVLGASYCVPISTAPRLVPMPAG